MGTTYHVTYVVSGSLKPPSQSAIENLLHEINQSVSTYIPSSVISQLNSSTDTQAWYPVDRHFASIFKRSREIYDDTKGAFNPAVGPLVNAWGFGPVRTDAVPDEATVQRLLQTVSFEAFEFQDSPLVVRKRLADAQLDFGAIAKGYAADAIANLFKEAHIPDYLVEIAGEVRAHGEHPDGKPWQVGIEKPAEDALAPRKVQTVVELDDRGLATSGNYRNFQALDGKTFGHILDPKTGYPVRNSLLSATVLAPDAMTADAYATAFIVMGVEAAMKLVDSHSELSAYFIVRGEGGQVIVERPSSRFPQQQ